MNKETKLRLIFIICKFLPLFGPINNEQIIDTNVRAEIRTSTEESVYAITYPYPVNIRIKVDEQLSKLLKDEIFRPSKCPYYSPTWIVEKKLD